MNSFRGKNNRTILRKRSILHNASYPINRPSMPPVVDKSRILHFPEEYNIGRVLIRHWNERRHDNGDEGDWLFLTVAQGSVTIPPGYEVQLVINRVSAKDLTPLSRLSAYDVQSIVIRYNFWYTNDPVSDDQLRYIEHLVGLYDLDIHAIHLTTQGLHSIAKLCGLQRLWLRAPENREGFTGKNLALLRDLTQLEEIYLVDVPLDGPGLDALQRLRHVSILQHGLHRYQGLADLQALRYTLRSLYIDIDWLRAIDLSDIGVLTHLELLSLSNSSGKHYGMDRLRLIEPEGFQSLSSLHNLRVLDLPDIHIASLASLHTLPRLEEIHLEMSDLVERYRDQLITLDLPPDGENMYVQPGVVDSILIDLGTLPALRRLVIRIPDTPFTNIGFAGLCQAHNLDYVDLSGNVFVDYAFYQLRHLVYLRTLYLANTAVTDRDMKTLAGMTKLEELNLSGTIVSDEGIVHLVGLSQLHSLNLSYTQVSSSSMPYISKLTQLCELDLSGVSLSDEGVQHLANLVKLQKLCFKYSNDSAENLHVLRSFEHLRQLSLDNIPQGTLLHLSELKKLEYLSLSNCSLSEADVAILQHLLAIRTLILTRVKLPDAGWRALGSLTHLQKLSVNHTNIQDKHLEYLAELPNLREFDLQYTQISDVGLPALKKMNALEKVDLSWTHIGHQSLKHLSLLQGLEILNVTGTNINKWGEVELRRRLPNT